jgi:hypothetical protein
VDSTLIIDQTKVRIDPDLVHRGAPPFPRSLAWWQRNMPLWVDTSETKDGKIVLTPNGKHADGRQTELTPAAAHHNVKAIARYLSNLTFLDFSDAFEIG